DRVGAADLEVVGSLAETVVGARRLAAVPATAVEPALETGRPWGLEVERGGAGRDRPARRGGDRSVGRDGVDREAGRGRGRVGVADRVGGANFEAVGALGE